MIRDALAAEWSKALRQRWGLFWAYGFAPLAGLLISIAGLLWLHSANPTLAAMTPPSLMKVFLDAAATARNPLVILFLIVGAANLFAGEYRWLTWRYMLVRNSRLNLLGAKLAVFLGLAGVGLALFAVGGLLTSVINAGLNQNSFQPLPHGGGATIIAAVLLAMLELARTGALVALVAVLSRAQTGSIIGVIVALLVLAFAENQATQQGVVWAQAILPGIAFDRLLAGAMGLSGGVPTGIAPEPGVLVAALVVLLAWIAVPAVAAGVVFARQDLSRE